jgi:hypothetical protein
VAVIAAVAVSAAMPGRVVGVPVRLRMGLRARIVLRAAHGERQLSAQSASRARIASITAR